MKFKDWKPVFLSCCLAATSIGSPGKVFAETKVEYVNAETVFEECPLNQISTMDYNGDLSTWTECTEYYTYFFYDNAMDPYFYGNKITYDTGVSKPVWRVNARVPYSYTSQSLDLLVIIDSSFDLSSLTYNAFQMMYSYPWYSNTGSNSGTSYRSATADTFVNDGQQIWFLLENQRFSQPCAGFGTSSSLNSLLSGSGVLECHIYYRVHHDITVEGGGSSGGGDSGSGGGSGGSSST